MVGILDDSCIRFPLYSRIKVGSNVGTVKYVGEVTGYAGTWLGIDWDDASRGKHDGRIKDKRYFFAAHATSGSFVQASKVCNFETLEETARKRYLCYDSNILDQSLITEAQQGMHAAFFEVVGMDKIARKQSKFEQLTEISVADSQVHAAGYLKEFVNLTTLNLSHTLIWNWQIVADICQQVPTLCDLNLSSNRLLLPQQVLELQPSFCNLKKINLRDCGFERWQDVLQTARLWPNIQSLGLQDNALSKLDVVDCNEVFKQLSELDLQRTRIMDFDEVCKLGNIKTLKSLNLLENGIEQIKLPDCAANEKLQIFVALEILNLQHNPIWQEADAFNELDKLPNLRQLSKTPHLKSDFNEMFSKAVGSIGNLQILNRIAIRAEDRRGAEIDMWKFYAKDWLQAAQQTGSAEALKEFYKKHRNYEKLLKKYGSPADFVPLNNGVEKTKSNLIKIRIFNKRTDEIWEKKVPRMITVQTLAGLIVKRFYLNELIDKMPKLSYVDAKNGELVVPLENGSKSLDFYSLQENDMVVVDW